MTIRYSFAMKKVRLIPFTCGAGACFDTGCAIGPKTLRDNDILSVFDGSDIDAEWAPFFDENPEYRRDVLPPLGTVEREGIVLSNLRHVYDETRRALNDGVMPVIIGGDHAMVAASMSALVDSKNAYEETGLLWFDAHPDINSPETSPSKALHGMPIASLLDVGHVGLRSFGQKRKKIKGENVCMFGIRSVDEEEGPILNWSGITYHSALETSKMGWDAALKLAQDRVAKGTKARAFSVDLDGFDPFYAPGVGTPVEQGIARDDGLAFIRAACRAIDFDLLEITEYNPVVDRDGLTADLVRDVLRAFFDLG